MKRFILCIFIVWRMSLELWRLVGERFIPAREGYLGPIHWANFDGVHYLGIAQRGYNQFEQAFFPLYPLLIRWLGRLLGGNFVLAGLLISNLSLLFALFIFWKLLRKVQVQEETIRWPLVFLLFFPTSFYFASIYTESLFLLFVLISFFALVNFKNEFSTVLHRVVENKTWIFVYLVAASLASAARFVGAFLLFPLGLLGYMVYLWKAYGDPLFFIHAQPAFGAHRIVGELIFLPQIFWRYLKIFATVSYENYTFWVAIIEVVFFIGALGLLWIAWKKNIPKSWILFSTAALIVPTFTGTLSSMPRYILPAFPIYIVMAKINRRYRYLLLIACYLLQAVLTALFISGYWIS